VKQIFNASLVLTLLFVLPLIALAGWDPTDDGEVKESDTAQEAIHAFKETDPDLEVFFDKAHGYVFSRLSAGPEWGLVVPTERVRCSRRERRSAQRP
jgi:hypothetical protein